MNLPLVEPLKHLPWPAITNFAALVIGGWIARGLNKTKAHQRAELLSTIARGAAALIVNAYPGRTWAELLAATVQKILDAAGLPTADPHAVERAAAEALASLGVKSNGV